MRAHRRLRRASEAVAALLLEDLGYRIVEVRRPLVVGGEEISDIDIVAERDGQLYAVEVKAGSADVGAVRQAYTNAVLAGMKPLIVARGVDDKARAAASRLGVEILVLPDLLLAGYEDLREAVREAVLSVVEEMALSLEAACRAGEEERRALEAIAESMTVQDLADRLGTTVEEAGKLLGRLRRKGLLPSGSFRVVRLAARISLLACRGGVPRP